MRSDVIVLAEYPVSMAFAVLTSTVFIVAGIMLIRHADMEINNTFGYRTPRSTKNQEIWRFANIYSGKIFIIGGAIGLVLIIAAALIMKSTGVTKLVWLVGVILELVIVFTAIPINMVSAEKQLIKRFDDKEENNDKG